MGRRALSCHVALVVLLLGGCDDRVDGDVGGQPPEPIASCSGTFACVQQGTSNQVVLQKKGFDCFAGSVILRNDHTVFDPKSGFTVGRWDGDRGSFTICDPERKACNSCRQTAPPTGTRLGSCTGTPAQCRSYSVQQCPLHSGCGVTSKGDACGGVSTECRGYVDEAACVAQGCSWVD